MIINKDTKLTNSKHLNFFDWIFPFDMSYRHGRLVTFITTTLCT